MKPVRIIEWIGFAMIVIGFCVDLYLSNKNGTQMSFTGPDNNYIFLAGLAIWAISYGVRKAGERKVKDQ